MWPGAGQLRSRRRHEMSPPAQTQCPVELQTNLRDEWSFTIKTRALRSHVNHPAHPCISVCFQLSKLLIRSRHWAMIKRWEQPQQWGGCYWEYCDKWRRDVTDITCHDGHDCHAIIIASAPGLHGITISILTKWYRAFILDVWWWWVSVWGKQQIQRKSGQLAELGHIASSSMFCDGQISCVLSIIQMSKYFSKMYQESVPISPGSTMSKSI